MYMTGMNSHAPLLAALTLSQVPNEPVPLQLPTTAEPPKVSLEGSVHAYRRMSTRRGVVQSVNISAKYWYGGFFRY